MDILKISSIFNKQATLLSDLAARTLISKRMLDENLDINALRFAAFSSAKTMILYGSLAIEEEMLQGYLGEDHRNSPWKKNVSNFYKKLGKFKSIKSLKKNEVNDNLELFINFLEFATETFLDVENWEEYKGGNRWAEISKKLSSIASLYKSALDGKDSPEEVETLKKIISEMTIYDQLAHNTTGIIEKMIPFEFYRETRGNSFSADSDDKKIREEKEKYNSLKDLSEMPEETGSAEEKAIEYLEMSLPFKDIITEIKSRPPKQKNVEYEQEFHKQQKHRKELKRHVGKLIETFERSVITLEKAIKATIEDVASEAPKYINNIYDLSEALYSQKENLLEELGAWPESYHKLSDIEKNKLLNLYKQISNIIINAFYKTKEVDREQKMDYIKSCENFVKAIENCIIMLKQYGQV